MQINLSKIFETPKYENHLHGYFDVPQLSKDNTNLLTLQIEHLDRYPDSKNKYPICIFDIKRNTKKIVSTTSIYNFQQGCRGQFVGPTFNDKIIFNDFHNGRYVSKIVNLINGNIDFIDYPIAAISSSFKFLISIDYERLFWCRKGYSYSIIKNVSKNKKIYKKECLTVFDIEKNIVKKAIYIEDLININFTNSMENATHYIEHVVYCPFDEKFLFLHRWTLADGGIYARLYHYNILKNELDLLVDSGRISHFNWINKDEIIFYGAESNKFNSLRKNKKYTKILKLILPVYKRLIKDNSSISKFITNDSYYLYRLVEKKGTKIANQLKSQDGHPTCFESNKVKFFITDDYSDIDNNSSPSLYFHDVKNNISKKIKSFKSISKLDNSPFRCDLHPRLSFDGKYVSIDTLDNGFRQSFVHKINF
tara:strand:+ start:984 stop:2249 length:1266 start_codon:yes stop_codon:yes gene_type:complete